MILFQTVTQTNIYNGYDLREFSTNEELIANNYRHVVPAVPGYTDMRVFINNKGTSYIYMAKFQRVPQGSHEFLVLAKVLY